MFDPRSHPDCQSCKEDGRLERPKESKDGWGTLLFVLLIGFAIYFTWRGISYIDPASNTEAYVRTQETEADNSEFGEKKRLILELIDVYKVKTGFSEAIELVFGDDLGYVRTAGVKRDLIDRHVVLVVNPNFLAKIPKEDLDSLLAHEFSHLILGHLDVPPYANHPVTFAVQEVDAEIKGIQMTGKKKFHSLLYAGGFTRIQADLLVKTLTSACSCTLPD